MTGAPGGYGWPVRTIATIDDLAQLCQEFDGALYVRWSRDCDRDLTDQTSIDELTGVPLPGLSANGLGVEPWWDDRPLDLWLARRFYDYRHLVELRGKGTRPWILTGDEVGRGPDNEPLITNCRLVASVEPAVIDTATERVDGLPRDWGSLRRG